MPVRNYKAKVNPYTNSGTNNHSISIGLDGLPDIDTDWQALTFAQATKIQGYLNHAFQKINTFEKSQDPTLPSDTKKSVKDYSATATEGSSTTQTTTPQSGQTSFGAEEIKQMESALMDRNKRRTSSDGQ